jgi:hypothetical protein
MGICSHKPNSIGTLDQFNHTGKLENPGIDSLFVKRFSNLGEENDLIVEEILSFWKPDLIGNIDSNLVQIVQISILSSLGFTIPFEWKVKCLELIRLHFLKSYLLEGKITRQAITNCFRAEYYLIQKGQPVNLYSERRKTIFARDNNDRRKDLNNERVIGLLYDTRIIFDEYANTKNRGQ